jgi:hypothetical protein
MHRGVLAAVGAGLVFAAGCGQTDYATEVGEDGARLNATITTLAEEVVTTAWFEYWPTANPAAKQQTPDQDIASTGPFSEDIGGLANHTEYQYRLCATEDDSPAVCAQTRRFTTGRDTVQAYGESVHIDAAPPTVIWIEDIDVDLVGEPSGVSGAGFLELHASRSEHLQWDIGGPSDVTDITCFEVSGNTAIVGLLRSEGESPQGFVQLVDGGPLGSKEDTVAATVNFPTGPQRDPSDCSSPLANPLPLKSGEIVINEAPPGPS